MAIQTRLRISTAVHRIDYDHRGHTALHLKVQELTGAGNRSMIAISENHPNMPPLRWEEERCP